MVSHDQVDCVYLRPFIICIQVISTVLEILDTVFKIPRVSCLSNRICKDPVESILACSGRQGQLKIYSLLRMVTL